MPCIAEGYLGESSLHRKSWHIKGTGTTLASLALFTEFSWQGKIGLCPHSVGLGYTWKARVWSQGMPALEFQRGSHG